MPHLITTLGPRTREQSGMILPHEHVFVDLRTWDKPGYGEADPADVIGLMKPELDAAGRVGVTALVECSPVGVGRRADILRAVSEAAGFPLVVPTGIYREPWIPPWAHEAAEDDLMAWMLGELQGQIENSGVQAGFVKLSAGDNGITPTERKLLRAAGRAAGPLNAAVASHTIRGAVVHDQLDELEAVGYPLDRFIWVHAHVEPDFALNLEMARRGAWIEYDGIGGDDQRDVERIRGMLDAGLGHRVLLSHDRGWYDPGQPGGGTPRPFTYLSEHFLPKLRASGIEDTTIEQLTHDNPFRAFAR
jgi:phosphotriesterase-related protein